MISEPMPVEMPRAAAERRCTICGMPCRLRGLAMHERACERHQMDDDPWEYARWLEQRRKLWRYRHKRDGQRYLEEVVE